MESKEEQLERIYLEIDGCLECEGTGDIEAIRNFNFKICETHTLDLAHIQSKFE